MDVSSAVHHTPGTLLSTFAAHSDVCLLARARSTTWGACRGHTYTRACCQHHPHKPLPHHKLDPELSSSLATTQHPCPCQSCPVWARWSWCGYCSPQQSPCPTAQHQQDPRPPPPSRLPSAGGNQVTFPIPASERTHLCLRGLFWIPGKL